MEAAGNGLRGKMLEGLLERAGAAIGYMLPAVQLTGVILASLIMTAVLVGMIVRALKRFSERGGAGSWKLLLALRFLLGFREEKRSWFRRLVPVATQNFIAMTGTAIGVWALIVVLSVMSGFELDLKDKIIRNNPHITVERCAASADDFDGGQTCQPMADRIGRIPDVVMAESFVQGDALLASSSNMGPGTTIRGITPGGALEARWLRNSVSRGALEGLVRPETTISDRDLGFVFPDPATRQAAEPGEAAVQPPARDGIAPSQPSEGRKAEDAATVGVETAELNVPPIAAPDEIDVPPIAEPDDGVRVRDGIILGSELALGLGVTEGDEVTVVIPDGDVGPLGLQPSTSVFRVVGTIKSGLYEFDLKTAFVLADSGRRLFSGASREQMAIMVSDIQKLEGIASEVQAVADGVPGSRVRTVTQTNRSLFSALMVERIAMFLVLGLVILVAAFNVFGSLLLVTMEKTRDIAVLRSMGVTASGIRSVYFTIGWVIGLTGTVSGLALGLLTCLYIKTAGIALPQEYYIERLPVSVSALDVALVALAALGAALIATIYPTSAVASMSPADGLRND